jgi:uncharacterized protein (DUF2062 family)
VKPLRRALESLLHIDDTPHRTALSFGIGVWIAFSPLLGIHTGMALAIAFAFRLNRLAILLGAYINNPWTLAPLYAAGTGVGCLLLGVPLEGLNAIDWRGAEDGLYQSLFASLRPFLWPYVIGNTVLGVVFGALAYFWLRGVLERRRVAHPA